MPSTSERQRRFMGADLARARAGQKTRTGMSIDQLRDFARAIHSRGDTSKAAANFAASRKEGYKGA